MNTDEKLLILWNSGKDSFHDEITKLLKKTQRVIFDSISSITNNLYAPEQIDSILQIINQVSLEKESKTLSFFFYIHWFVFARRSFRITEAQIILSKMKDLLSPSLSNILKAEYYFRKAELCAMNDVVSNFKKGLDLIDESSSQYKRNIGSLADIYSQNGLLADLGASYIDQLLIPHFHLFSFINAVELGQTNKAIFHREQLNDRPKYPTPIEARLKNSNTLLELMLENKNLKQKDDWYLSTKALIEKDAIMALNYAKSFQSQYTHIHLSLSSFSRLSFLRAELSNGSVNSSKKILNSLRQDGWYYFFEDFFYARIELLQGSTDKAIWHFSKLLKICKKYDAFGRLDIELELALELKPKQIRLLMSNHPTAVLATSKNKVDIDNEEDAHRYGINRLLGKSAALQSVKDDIITFASSDIPILILGETGVGKDVIANAIHEESIRKNEPFLAINCSAIAESLLQSELFGHEAGAYTGATTAHKGIFHEAGKGTVFLDEIGDISIGMQVALLRILESGEYRPVGSAKPRKIKCRIIAATNALLETKVDNGFFRMDLLYRLKRLVIKMPPLRERPVDITFLSNHFLNLERNSLEYASLSDDLEEAFLTYPWQGNIRELKNEIEKLRLFNSDKTYYELSDADFLKESREMKATISPKSESPHSNEPSNKHLKKNKRSAELVILNSTSPYRRLEVIKSLFMEHKILTRKEIFQILDVSNLTIGRDLKKLQKERFINKVEPSKSPRSHYFILKK